jgi:hypothetical protein
MRSGGYSDRHEEKSQEDGEAVEAEQEIELMLARLTDDGIVSILPRLRCALALIERSAAFEGDGDLAAAHLVLHDLIRDFAETRDASEPALFMTQ